MNPLVSLVSGAIAPIASVFNKRTERKMARDSLNTKQALAKQEGATSVTLTDAEFEAIGKGGENDTWKDEYVTLIVTSPIVLILGGALWLSVKGDSRILDGTIAGINALASTGVDMGFLMEAVVLAAVSLKVWRKA